MVRTRLSTRHLVLCLLASTALVACHAGRNGYQGPARDSYTSHHHGSQTGAGVRSPATSPVRHDSRSAREPADVEWRGLGGPHVPSGASLPLRRYENGRDNPVTGEQYQRYEENTPVNAAHDPLSTFAIDVDTASYTIMRRDVLAGRRPHPHSVRVEEYVNYFDYGYRSPADPGTPFAVHAEAAPSPFRPGRHLLRVALKGYEVPDQARRPANLIFLIDTSGSMAGHGKLGLVQYATQRLVHMLDGGDSVGIVTYAEGVSDVLGPTSVSHRRQILDRVNHLNASGGTNGAAGLQRAYNMAERGMRPGSANRVILCTDGDFNIGATGDDLVRMVERWRDRGIYLSVLLFGAGNINDADMERAANRGNGHYLYIDDSLEADQVFGERLTSTLQTIAKDVKVQVEFNPAVVSHYRLLGYENRALRDEHFRNDYVDAGELGSGHTVTAFYEVELRGDEPPGGPLADLRLRYLEPDAHRGDTAVELVAAIDSAVVRHDFDSASAPYRFGAAVAHYAQILRRSHYANEGDMHAVLEIAGSAADRENAGQLEFVELVRRAQHMRIPQ